MIPSKSPKRKIFSEKNLKIEKDFEDFLWSTLRQFSHRGTYVFFLRHLEEFPTVNT